MANECHVLGTFPFSVGTSVSKTQASPPTVVTDYSLYSSGRKLGSSRTSQVFAYLLHLLLPRLNESSKKRNANIERRKYTCLSECGCVVPRARRIRARRSPFRIRFWPPQNTIKPIHPPTVYSIKLARTHIKGPQCRRWYCNTIIESLMDARPHTMASAPTVCRALLIRQ